MKYLKKHKKKIFSGIILSIIIILTCVNFSSSAKNYLLAQYNSRRSAQITDRHGKLISLKPNSQGYYAEYINEVPEDFAKIILQKEDRYFYYHPGINPFSILRAIKNYLMGNSNLASSTITQQLAKILLANEKKRTLMNKVKESYYALMLEANFSKKEILTMYANSVFLGNGVQGVKSASRLYFGKSPEALTEEEALSLAAAISNPSNNNPFDKKIMEDEVYPPARVVKPRLQKDAKEKLQSDFFNYCHNEAEFEINDLTNDKGSCRLAIDRDLTAQLREILKRNLESLLNKNATNGAIVVIKVPKNELLAIVGSPQPSLGAYGYKINMAVKPRPIGSTIKPFIYLKGFEKGLRPYTMVDDKEYKYTIGTGFAFYPKNYDYQYRGPVTLHYALSNSLNVPAVKVLEYAGIDNFNNFLLNDLNFKPVQDLDNYQLGIALGELEMDLFTLSRYFTIFANNGKLKPLAVSTASNQREYPRAIRADNVSATAEVQISQPSFIQLINKILSDRLTGVEQFGQKSDLNLYVKNYAVKTGTSREYHDSWVMGYTPDFLVGVWVGNSDDTAMDSVSGQSGAGMIWHEAMNLLLTSPYNKNTPFDFSLIKEFPTADGMDFGLPNDDQDKIKNLLQDESLISTPHDGDTILFKSGIKIPLDAREEMEWQVNGKFIGKGKEIFFQPEKTGAYEIEGKSSNLKKNEKINILIEEEE